MPRIVPKTWMPDAGMRRIHLHWTAGAHTANATDKKAYHILVEGDGKLVKGKFGIEANERPVRGRYAAHTLDANSRAIGVSLCCMAGAVERPFDAGTFPMTEEQWEAGTKVIADLSEAYGILVTPTTVLTHAEVWPNLNIRQRNKWDITRLAFDSSIKGFQDVGEELRSSVAALLAEDDFDTSDDIADEHKLPRYRVSGVYPSRLNFRRSPGGEKIGSLPDRSIVERLGVIDEWWRVRTRAGYEGYVHSGFLKRVD